MARPALQKFRIKSMKSLAGPLAAHILGETRPWNAVPRSGMDPVLYYDQSGLRTTREVSGAIRFAVNDYLQEEKEKRRKLHLVGRPPTGVIDIMAAGPEWDMPPELRDAFVRESVLWLKQGLGPRSQIAMAVAHTDEKMFHSHIAAVCVDEAGNLGWMKVRNRLAELPCDEFPNPDDMSEKEILSRLQDMFHKHVTSKFEIERGHRYLVSGANPRTYVGGPDRVKSLLERGYADGVEQTREQAKTWIADARKQGREAGVQATREYAKKWIADAKKQGVEETREQARQWIADAKAEGLNEGAQDVQKRVNKAWADGRSSGIQDIRKAAQKWVDDAWKKGRDDTLTGVKKSIDEARAAGRAEGDAEIKRLTAELTAAKAREPAAEPAAARQPVQARAPASPPVAGRGGSLPLPKTTPGLNRVKQPAPATEQRQAARPAGPPGAGGARPGQEHLVRNDTPLPAPERPAGAGFSSVGRAPARGPTRR